MYVRDVVSLARLFLNDPASAGRWSDASLISFTNEAGQEIIRDVEFPVSRIVFQTVANQQEYQTPELIYVKTVYLAGQIIVPTELSAIEGHQTQEYDQGFGTMPGMQTPGSGGPPGTEGMYTPAWNIQTPTAYPVANTDVIPAPDAAPWSNTQRPRWYYRSGYMGFIPAPAAAYTACIDALVVPPTLAALNDPLPFPSQFKRAMAWKVCEYAKFSNDTQADAEGRTYAAQQYERSMRKLRTDAKRYDGDQPRMPKMLTYRRFYYIGNNRSPAPWTEYP